VLDFSYKGLNLNSVLLHVMPTQMLLMHSFRLVTWHACLTLGLTVPDMNIAQRKRQYGRRETGGEPAESL
jgi:hypothetical protein